MDFKYKLGEIVYYMRSNKIRAVPVLSRTMVDNSKDAKPFGPSLVQYATRDGTFNENQLFSSKTALLRSLLTD